MQQPRSSLDSSPAGSRPGPSQRLSTAPPELGSTSLRKPSPCVHDSFPAVRPPSGPADRPRLPWPSPHQHSPADRSATRRARRCTAWGARIPSRRVAAPRGVARAETADRSRGPQRPARSRARDPDSASTSPPIGCRVAARGARRRGDRRGAPMTMRSLPHRDRRRPEVVSVVAERLREVGIPQHSRSGRRARAPATCGAATRPVGCRGAVLSGRRHAFAAAAALGGVVVHDDREALLELVEPIDLAGIDVANASSPPRSTVCAATGGAPDPARDRAAVARALADTVAGSLVLDDGGSLRWPSRWGARGASMPRSVCDPARASPFDRSGTGGGRAGAGRQRTALGGSVQGGTGAEAAVPASLLAVSALLRGDGALANVALDRAQRPGPGTCSATGCGPSPRGARAPRSSATVCSAASRGGGERGRHRRPRRGVPSRVDGFGPAPPRAIPPAARCARAAVAFGLPTGCARARRARSAGPRCRSPRRPPAPRRRSGRWSSTVDVVPGHDAGVLQLRPSASRRSARARRSDAPRRCRRRAARTRRAAADPPRGSAAPSQSRALR